MARWEKMNPHPNRLGEEYLNRIAKAQASGFAFGGGGGGGGGC